MPLEPRPPFRADQVGSLLRPGSLHEARAKAKRGEIDAQALRTIEDRCIREAVAKQEAIGLSGITDGNSAATGGISGTQPTGVLSPFSP